MWGWVNPTSYYNGTRYTFTWEQGRRLATAVKGSNSLSFTYNDEGIRTSKTVNGVVHTYHLAGSRIIAEEWGNNLIIYLYDAEGSPIGMQYRKSTDAIGAFETYWFEKNLQGDIVAVYNENGTKLVSYTYDAWGNVTTTYHNGGASTAVQYNPFRYRGYYYDSETGLYYVSSRYYDPEIGRWINADSVIAGTGENVLGYNMFAYCLNEPVFRKDAHGTEGVVVENFDEDNNPHNDLGKSPSGQGSGGGGKGKSGGHSGGSKGSVNNSSGHNGRGAQNPTVRSAIQRGQEMHKQMDYGDGVKKEQSLGSKYRVDGIDKDNRIIYELKPNNPRAIVRGVNQLNNYLAAASQLYRGKWTGVLVLYD